MSDFFCAPFPAFSRAGSLDRTTAGGFTDPHSQSSRVLAKRILNLAIWFSSSWQNKKRDNANEKKAISKMKRVILNGGVWVNIFVHPQSCCYEWTGHRHGHRIGKGPIVFFGCLCVESLSMGTRSLCPWELVRWSLAETWTASYSTNLENTAHNRRKKRSRQMQTTFQTPTLGLRFTTWTAL